MNNQILTLIKNLELLNGGDIECEDELLMIAESYTNDCDITISNLNQEIKNILDN